MSLINVLSNVGSTVARAATRIGIGIGAPVVGAALLANQIANNRKKYNTLGSETGTLLDEKQQYFTNISIGEYKRDPTKLITFGANNRDATFLKIATIFTLFGYRLPLPLKLVDKNSVQWTTDSLVSADKGMAKLSQGMLGKAASEIANVPAAIQSLAGAAPNEFLTMLFKGPSYKEFTLQFLISPHTPQQSIVFRKMVTDFKNAMAPSLTGGNLLFTYPNVFKITFNSTSGGVKPFLYEFKPAVLKSFSVDYAPANVPSFYAGTDEPESFVLNMDFQEIEFWLAGDFK